MNTTASRYTTLTVICMTLSALAALLLVIGPIGTREALFHFRIGLLLMSVAFVLGGIMVIANAILALLPRQRPARQGYVLGLAMALIPALAAVNILGASAGLPMIHDISTDIADPPEFRAALALRGDDSNPLQRDRELDRQQQEAYPNIRPIIVNQPAEQSFEQARAIAAELGWDVHHKDLQSGLIEATFTSKWFGFVDDVVIRVRDHVSGGTQIDLRSVSRVGKGDLGANAARISEFSARFIEP